MRVGIEIGGTFTDLVATDGNVVLTAKVPSVPRRPEEGAFAALAAAGIPLDAITDLVHGSTVATNAVLERKGGSTALVVTAGFRDLMLIQRQDRASIYKLDYRKPTPIVRRSDVLEVPERMLPDGTVLKALDVEAFRDELFDFIESRQIDSLAICLLNAYANPVHEEALAQAVRVRYPDLHVTCSSEISREFREYERASTTVLSAYVRPVIDAYVTRFAEALAEGGFRGRFSIMQSNGGRLPVPAIRRNAITTLFSGPAAGVIGAIRQLQAEGYRNLITFDMGGTSTDVCVVTDGKPGIASETFIDGLPIRTPVIDIATVGAGGGSIIWRDDGGMLRVGPQSSAANPGPACYGRGGALPTVTDAHLIRGTLQPQTFLGGRMKLDVDAAREAFRPLAEQFGMSVEKIADSAVRIADGNVVRAIQLISTEVGRDPRDYVLVPFGGAGPLHAGRIAEELGVQRIVVPRNAGILSAFGLLASDFMHFESITRKTPLTDKIGAEVGSVFAELEAALLERFREYGIDQEVAFSRTLLMRFVGQAFELEIELPDELDDLTADIVRQRFDEVHRQIYFHDGGSVAGRALEVVGYRLGGAVARKDYSLPVQLGSGDRQSGAADIFEGGEARASRLLNRAEFDHTGGAEGPTLLDDGVSTTFILPGWRGRSDASQNLIIELGTRP